jgi:hypothetical protein
MAVSFRPNKPKRFTLEYRLNLAHTQLFAKGYHCTLCADQDLTPQQHLSEIEDILDIIEPIYHAQTRPKKEATNKRRPEEQAEGPAPKKEKSFLHASTRGLDQIDD